MLNPTLGGAPDRRLTPEVPNPADPGLVSGGGRAPAAPPVLSSVDFHVRRLRYFLDLLDEGYHQALRPDPTSRSMRVERIALGIDQPELDTVPLWSMRRHDGAVSIPFIEFILWHVGQTLHALCDDIGEDRREAARLRESRGMLLDALDRISPPGEGGRSVPRHHDILIPEGLMRELCGPEGLLGGIARQCDAIAALRPRGEGH